MTASVTGSWPRSARTSNLRHALWLVLGAAAILASMVLLGWLVTGRLAHAWPLRAEDGFDRALARHRNHTLDLASGFFSKLGDTQAAIALSVVAFFTVRVLTHRWIEPLLIATALVTEVSVFLVTTVVVKRARPAVSHLDHAPPTSSFPSGHTAAAVALYATVALVLWRHTAAWPAWLLLTVPCAVGLSRLYRGMHHPSDVVAGAVLGTLCVVLAQVWCGRLVRHDPVNAAPTPG